VDLGLAGKTAIVTGGSRGIGKAIALELAREGVRVAIVARDASALDAAAAEIAAETGSHLVAIAGDTGSDRSVKAIVARAAQELGGIDILVNAAAQPGGQAPPPKLAEIDDAVAWPDLNVKVLGYLPLHPGGGAPHGGSRWRQDSEASRDSLRGRRARRSGACATWRWRR